MAVQTDDEPEDERRKAVILIIIGLVLGIAMSVGAYLFTYEDMGTGPDDPYGRSAATLMIFLGFVLATVMVVIGAATYWSERSARE